MPLQPGFVRALLDRDGEVRDQDVEVLRIGEHRSSGAFLPGASRAADHRRSRRSGSSERSAITVADRVTVEPLIVPVPVIVSP